MSDVIVVDASGVARRSVGILQEQARRAFKVLEDATPPLCVSDAIPVAPARGAQIVERPVEAIMTDSGPRVVGAAFGEYRVRVGDAFDKMEESALRSHKRHRPDEVFVPPFTPGQVQAARAYATLVERLDASGLKCSSPETQIEGGASDLTMSEAVSRDMDRLAMLRRRVGPGLAKDKVRPSKGGMRSAIRLQDLVDQVCCGERTLSEVMRHSGWGNNARIRGVLRDALARALDRMQGYDLDRIAE